MDLEGKSREELIYLSKIADTTERYEDMLKFVKQLAIQKQECIIEERNILLVACMNTIGNRRTTWRTLSSIEQKEKEATTKTLEILRNYRNKIEVELSVYCNDILNILDMFLIPQSGNPENKVFFLKLKGDYNRYISEYALKEEHSKASENALQTYSLAYSIATQHLNTTNTIRLGLVLNFSVFYYEVRNDP
jgi:14-3-3 protein epsilon